MKELNASKVLTGLLLSLAVAGMAVGCGPSVKEKAAAQRSMVVVFASGNAQVVQNGQSASAKVGLVVNENDQIKTEQGTLDLQTKSGSAIRVGEFTTVTVAKLVGEGSSETKLGMQHGSILANVKKASGEEGFSVVTPTAIAGVRGTTFSVNVRDDKPVVKVYEGKVAMSPRVIALEGVKKEDIQKNDTLKVLSEIQNKAEVVLEEKTTGTLNPVVAEKIEKINKATAEAKQDKQNLNDVVAVKEATAEIKKAVEDPKNESIQKQEVVITPEEKMEQKTLITVEPEVIEKLIAAKDKGATTQKSTDVQQLVKQREVKENQIIDLISSEASRVELKNNKEIEEFYNKIETLVLKDNSRVSGAVIAQTGNIFVIHTVQGVKKIQKSDVVSQEMGE